MNTHLVAEYTLTGAGDCTGHYGFRSVQCMLYNIHVYVTKEPKDANIAQDIYIHEHTQRYCYMPVNWSCTFL